MHWTRSDFCHLRTSQPLQPQRNCQLRSKLIRRTTSFMLLILALVWQKMIWSKTWVPLPSQEQASFSRRCRWEFFLYFLRPLMQSAAHANQIRTLMVWMLTFVDLMQVSGNYVSLIIVHSNIQNPTYVLPFFKVSLTVMFSHSHFLQCWVLH